MSSQRKLRSHCQNKNEQQPTTKASYSEQSSCPQLSHQNRILPCQREGKVAGFELELPAGSCSHTFQLTAPRSIPTHLSCSIRSLRFTFKSNMPSNPNQKHPVIDETGRFANLTYKDPFPASSLDPSLGPLPEGANTPQTRAGLLWRCTWLRILSLWQPG